MKEEGVGVSVSEGKKIKRARLQRRTEGEFRTSGETNRIDSQCRYKIVEDGLKLYHTHDRRKKKGTSCRIRKKSLWKRKKVSTSRRVPLTSSFRPSIYAPAQSPQNVRLRTIWWAAKCASRSHWSEEGKTAVGVPQVDSSITLDPETSLGSVPAGQNQTLIASESRRMA